MFINVLPLSGIFTFSWSRGELMFVYVVQNVLLIMLYSVLVSFATREPKLDKNTPRAVPIPFISNRSGWTQIAKWLPPVSYWNLQFIIWPLVFSLVFWQIVGVLLVDMSDLNFIIEGGPDTPAGDYITVITAAASVEAIMIAVLIFGMMCALVSRKFLDQEQYKHFSAPELAEIPIRVGLYWFVSLIFVHLVVILSYPFISIIGLPDYMEFRVVGIFLILKILADLSVLNILEGKEPEKIVYWFTFFWSGSRIDGDS